MLFFPNAKINLGLNVLRKRPDGFHEIDTVMYPLPVTDAVEILWSGTGADEFRVYGEEIPGKVSDNLCYKAVALLRKQFSFKPVQVILLKNLPMGAGIGGGSSDAVSTLRLVSEFCNLEVSREQMLAMAAGLGSDCPFFVDNTASHVTGRGERLEKIDLDLSGAYFILVFPAIHISTAAAFSKITPHPVSNDTRTITARNKNTWRTELKNDFEEGIVRQHPVIGEIRDQLYRSGAFYASLSGSGSAVYGLFERSADIPPEFGLYRCWKGKLT